MAHENNKICRVFKALSEPKRYRIVTMLANGKMSASEILKHFNVTQPTLSHDMRLLMMRSWSTISASASPSCTS